MQSEHIVLLLGKERPRGLGCEEFLVPSLRDYEASRHLTKVKANHLTLMRIIIGFKTVVEWKGET
jgi:hypothetical protein